jgi:hypothetical protein
MADSISTVAEALDILGVLFQQPVVPIGLEKGCGKCPTLCLKTLCGLHIFAIFSLSVGLRKTAPKCVQIGKFNDTIFHARAPTTDSHEQH